MRKGIFFFRFEFEAWVRDTAHMDRVDRDIYLHMLIAYYRNGGPFPDDITSIERLCGVATLGDRRKMARILTEFFQKSPSISDPSRSVWCNRKADEIIENINAISEKRASAAKHKHSKCSANAGANGVQDRSYKIEEKQLLHAEGTTPLYEHGVPAGSGGDAADFIDIED